MILVVDDDDHVRRILVINFELWGWTVLSANSVMSAVAQFEEHKERIAAIISDHYMGGIGRNSADLYFTCAEEIARLEIPFFMMTGMRDQRVIRAAQNTGMYIVYKPFSFSDLKGQLIALIGDCPNTSGHKP